MYRCEQEALEVGRYNVIRVFHVLKLPALGGLVKSIIHQFDDRDCDC